MEIATQTTGQDIRYTATIDGSEVGFLLAHETGLILNVEVDEDHQGEGIATSLFHFADEAQGLYHTPEWGLTPAGEAFAFSVGGDTMDEAEAAEILGVALTDIYGYAA